jgi:hypothetical protein
MADEAALRAFRDMIRLLTERPHLFVQPLNYYTVAAFIDGYMCALRESLDQDVSGGFTEWLKSKGTLGGVHWPFAILIHLASENEATALALAPSLLLEYLDSLLD